MRHDYPTYYYSSFDYTAWARSASMLQKVLSALATLLCFGGIATFGVGVLYPVITGTSMDAETFDSEPATPLFIGGAAAFGLGFFLMLIAMLIGVFRTPRD